MSLIDYRTKHVISKVRLNPGVILIFNYGTKITTLSAIYQQASVTYYNLNIYYYRYLTLLWSFVDIYHLHLIIIVGILFLFPYKHLSVMINADFDFFFKLQTFCFLLLSATPLTMYEFVCSMKINVKSENNWINYWSL